VARQWSGEPDFDRGIIARFFGENKKMSTIFIDKKVLLYDDF
jgi:hypothetical protein